MPKYDEPLVEVHANLYKADWEYLTQHFGPGSATPVGASAVVREIVRQKIMQYRASARQQRDAAQ